MSKEKSHKFDGRPEREKVGLPPRIIFYTVDQLATMLEMKESYIKTAVFFYEEREPGIRPKGRMLARNLAPDGETPEWRVSETELLRYLRYKGVKFYERGYVL